MNEFSQQKLCHEADSVPEDEKSKCFVWNGEIVRFRKTESGGGFKQRIIWL